MWERGDPALGDADRPARRRIAGGFDGPVSSWSLVSSVPELQATLGRSCVCAGKTRCARGQALSSVSGAHWGVWDRVPNDKDAAAVSGSVSVPPCSAARWRWLSRAEAGCGGPAPAEAARGGRCCRSARAAWAALAACRPGSLSVGPPSEGARHPQTQTSPVGRWRSREARAPWGSVESVVGEEALHAWLPGGWTSVPRLRRGRCSSVR